MRRKSAYVALGRTHAGSALAWSVPKRQAGASAARCRLMMLASALPRAATGTMGTCARLHASGRAALIAGQLLWVDLAACLAAKGPKCMRAEMQSAQALVCSDGSGYMLHVRQAFKCGEIASSERQAIIAAYRPSTFPFATRGVAPCRWMACEQEYWSERRAGECPHTCGTSHATDRMQPSTP